MVRFALATFGRSLGERRAGEERALVRVDCLRVDGIEGVRLVEWAMMIMVLAAPLCCEGRERQLGMVMVSQHTHPSSRPCLGAY